MFVVTAAEVTAEAKANILINRYSPPWGCPRSILSDNGLQFCSKLSHIVHKLLGIRKLNNPRGNGGVERVNDTMAQNYTDYGRQRPPRRLGWQLPHVVFAYNLAVTAATGLAPNEVHMGRFRRLPLTVFDRSAIAGHQSLARDRLAYCDLASERQQRANDIVRERRAWTVSRVERQNSTLWNAFAPGPQFRCGIN